MTRLVQIAAMALLLLIGTPWLANAQDAEHLKGLTAVAVHVDPIVSLNASTRVQALALMTQLEADIQQRLRQAGITIVPGQAPRPFGTQGNLWASVMIIESSPGSSQWFLRTSVTLYGSVVLAGSNERAEAITWATERYQIVDTSQIDARLREDLNFLIDDFSKAYQSANPR
jgi:hypothetical protein